MRLRHLLPLVLLGLAPLAAATDGGAAAAGPKVGIIYLERVFEESLLVRRNSSDLTETARSVKQTVDEMTEKLERTKSEMQTYHPSQEKYQEFEEQLELLRLKRKLYVQRKQEELDQRELELLKESYQAIKAQLADYCADHGLALVFLAPSPALHSQRVNELRLELATHTILYHEDHLDITDAFIAYANERAPSADPPAPDASSPAIDLGATLDDADDAQP